MKLKALNTNTSIRKQTVKDTYTKYKTKHKTSTPTPYASSRNRSASPPPLLCCLFKADESRHTLSPSPRPAPPPTHRILPREKEPLQSTPLRH
jgi:hypothetical protein